MTVSLDSLDLDSDTRELCRQVVRKMAYSKWLAAGSPVGDGLPFWIEAEREWIERHYVPPRLPVDHSESGMPLDETPSRVFSARITVADAAPACQAADADDVPV